MDENNIDLPEENKKNIPGSNKKIRIAIITAVVIIILAIIFFVVFVTQNKVDDKSDLSDQDVTKQDDHKDEDDIKKALPIRYGKMWLSTEDEDVNVGDEIEVDILMDTQKSNIVLAMAIIEFDEQKLEFIGRENMADVKDSVLKMSVFNLREGNKIEIVRGTPGDTDYLDTDDGFNGSEGLLATLKFKVLEAGETEVILGKICRSEVDDKICDQSSMVLDDGNGTAMKVEFEDLGLFIR